MGDFIATFLTVDASGNKREIKGRATEVQNPPASASELSKYHGACIFEELGKRTPRQCPVAGDYNVSSSDCVSIMAITESCLFFRKDDCTIASLGVRKRLEMALVEANRDVTTADGQTKLLFVAKLPAGSEAARLEKRDRGVHTESWFARRDVECGREREREVVDDNDHEFEEREELRSVTVGRATTERGENMKRTTISVYREWCEVCVAARDTGGQHQHRRVKRPSRART